MSAPSQAASSTPEGRQLRVRVCIATFRRPALLRRTLDSVSAQRFSRCEVNDLGVIVVDNDAAQEGRAVVAAARAGSPWPIEYLVEPNPGISHARNRLVAAAAGADYLAMIDDDEAADETWLDALLATALEKRADAVLGPVEPVFDVQPTEWMRPFFLRRRHETGTRVTADDFRTSNVLFRARALQDTEGPFDPEFGLTGGEDSLLGRLLQRDGARFYWADDALVRERIPCARTRISWILKRRFRSAGTLTAIRIRMLGRGAAVPLVLYRTAGALALGNAQIAGSVLGGRRRLLAGLANLASGAGNLAGLAGVTTEGYGAGRGDHAAFGPKTRSRA
jgi:succinoglycan biosynthesis protein ExoM